MIIKSGKTIYKVSFTFIAFIVLMLLICDEKIIFLSFMSSVVHESGHLFFMYLTGDKPTTVELSLFGMRIDRSERSKFSYGKETLICLGGIIFNLIFSFICYIIYLLFGKEIFLMLTVVNIIIVIINSVPVGVLDLSRAFRCILSIHFDKNKCEKALDIISYIFVAIFSVITLTYCIFVRVNISLIAVTVYIFTVTVIKKWS